MMFPLLGSIMIMCDNRDLTLHALLWGRSGTVGLGWTSISDWPV